MKAQILDTEALRAVAPISLHAYLRSQGWQKSAELGQRGVVYEKGGHPEIVAPAKKDLADYASAIARILRVLEIEEDRSQLAVLSDLEVSDVDLLRVRASHADSNGSLPLESGVELIRQSRDMLLAAACASVRPQRLFRSGGNKEATEYLDKVRLGQTERGSFVATLLSPVPPDLIANVQKSFWPEMESEPFGRKVTRRLVDALRASRDAISSINAGGNIEAFERVVPVGVSANLCSAVAKLIRDGQGTDISVNWAVTRPAPEQRAMIKFSDTDADVLEEATLVLTSREPRPNERILGFVTKLAREPNADEGTVTLKAVVDEKLTSVTMDLDKPQYSLAVRAHESRSLFVLEGDLDRVGQRWSLRNPRHVEPPSMDADESD